MDLLQLLANWLGYHDRAMGTGLGEMALRAVVAYVVTVAMLRIGERRSMSQTTAFDLILSVVIGSTVSRAITGNAPLVPALGSAGVLIVVHWVVAVLAVRSPRFDLLVKGRSRELVREGEVLEGTLASSHLTERDLEEALRRNQVKDLARVESAYRERNGQVSVLPGRLPPRVVDVRVADGVQTVRLELAG